MHNGSELKTSALVRLSCSHGRVVDVERNTTDVFSARRDLIARLSCCSCERHPHSHPACHRDAIKAPPRLLGLLRPFLPPAFPFHAAQPLKSSSSCSFLFRTQESGVLLSVRCVVRRRRHWIGRRWRPRGG